MGCEVVEVSSTSGDVGLQSPWEVGLVVVEFAWRYCETDLYGEYFSDLSDVCELFYFLEVVEISSVVCHEAGHSCLFGYFVHSEAVFIACGERFFYVDGFSGSHCHDGECGV